MGIQAGPFQRWLELVVGGSQALGALTGEMPPVGRLLLAGDRELVSPWEPASGCEVVQKPQDVACIVQITSLHGLAMESVGLRSRSQLCEAIPLSNGVEGHRRVGELGVEASQTIEVEAEVDEELAGAKPRNFDLVWVEVVGLGVRFSAEQGGALLTVGP